MAQETGKGETMPVDDTRRLRRAADRLKPLASTPRLRVLLLLDGRELRSEDLRAEIGATTQSASQQLS